MIIIRYEFSISIRIKLYKKIHVLNELNNACLHAFYNVMFINFLPIMFLHSVFRGRDYVCSQDLSRSFAKISFCRATSRDGQSLMSTVLATFVSHTRLPTAIALIGFFNCCTNFGN